MTNWITLKRLRAAVVIVTSLLVSGFSQTGITQDADATKPELEYFEKHIRPLLVARCYECHAGEESSGGLRLDHREHWMAGGDSGPALVPGRPDESLLVKAIRYRDPDLKMPPKSPLSAEEVAKLEKWIATGGAAPASTGMPAIEKPKGLSLEEGRQFWAFRPLSDPEIPLPRDRSWSDNPIDAFVLAHLERQAIAPSPVVDRRTWLRRVTLDLTGIPPTIDEIAAFLADTSPEADRTVVDRLLASPRYGVRWGRHWLDVVRYADSNGLDENLAYGNAWRYRDYVVDAFNQDKPYDNFVREQIAGDLLENADQESKTATGFLVLGAKVLAEPDKEKLMMDIIDEQLDTIGKTFWGMTLGCVRCHDHKFDPITQSDYYGLAAIFKSTKTMGDTNVGAIKHWHEHLFASPEDKARVKLIDDAIAAKKKELADFKRQAITKARATARSQGVTYLVAAAQLPEDCSLIDAEPLAERFGLNPHVLHHCCRYLARHRDDPLFSPWFERRAAGDWSGIEAHYRPLFERTEEAVAAQKKADPKVSRLDEPELEMVRQHLADGSGFLAIPSKPDFAFEAETLRQYHALSEEARLLESRAPDLPAAMGVTDTSIATSIPIHIRGSHRNLGAPVSRAFPSVMLAHGTPPIFPRNESGRLELAEWMTEPSHPLTARVYVNRIWRWHFGRGIVGSTDNFGTTGELPADPELLDWLTRYFIEANWSTKALNRLIVTSKVYRLSVDPARQAPESDPENRWLWRFPRKRLEAEQIRDSVLAIAGQLDESFGGKTIALRNRQFVFDHRSTDHSEYDFFRRSIYIPVIRNHLYKMFEQFDFPDPTMPTGHRNETTVPSQALWMMNSQLVIDISNRLAERLLATTSDFSARIEFLHQTILGRPASAIDDALAKKFFVAWHETPSSATSVPSDSDDRLRDLEQATSDSQEAWAVYCQTLFASNEFVFIR